MLVLLDQLPVLLTLSLLVTTHASLVEGVPSPLANLGYAAHGLEGSLDEIAVVPHGNVAALSEGESGVVGHFLVVRAAFDDSMNALKERLYALILLLTALSSRALKSRRSSDTSLTSICEDSRPGCTSWQI
jgi:hypothetical protein